MEKIMKKLLFIATFLIIPAYLNSAYIFNPQDQKTRSVCILKNPRSIDDRHDASFNGSQEDPCPLSDNPDTCLLANLYPNHNSPYFFNRVIAQMKEYGIKSYTVAEIGHTKQTINHERIGTIEWNSPTFYSQDLSPKVNIDRHHPLCNAPLKKFAARYLIAHNIDTAQR